MSMMSIRDKIKSLGRARIVSVVVAVAVVVLLVPIVANIKRQQSSSALPNTANWDFATSDHYLYNGWEINLQPGLGNLRNLPTQIKFDGSSPIQDHPAITIPSPYTPPDIVNDPQNPNNKVYKMAGMFHFSSKPTHSMPFSSNLQYRITARARKVNATDPNTSLLMGMSPTNQFGETIAYSTSETRGTIDGEPAVIQAYDDNKITTSGADLTKWLQGGVDAAASRRLGFFFNGGDISQKAPESVIACNDGADSANHLSSGVYSIAQNNTIFLNCSIPDAIKAKIRLGVTKIINVNVGGSTFNWGTAGVTSDSWQTFTHTSAGYMVDQKPYLANGVWDKFMRRTRRVSFAFIANFVGDQRHQLYSDDITLDILGGQPPYSWAAPTIENKSPHAFSGKALSFSNQLDAGTTDQEVKYQISKDGGATWQWWDGTKWANVDKNQHFPQNGRVANYSLLTDTLPETQANSASVINANIQSLTTTGGQFKWRAFLISNGHKQVGLRSVSFTGEAVPSAPQNLTASQKTVPAPTAHDSNAINSLNQVALAWQAVADEGSSPLTGYQVFYKLSSQDDNHWVLATTTAPTDYAFTVQNLTYKQNYDFKVVAVNSVGGSVAARVNNVLIKDTTAPLITGANDVTILQGATFDAKAGITASDNVDGAIAVANIQVHGDVVNTNTPGTYTVVYLVEDSSRNKTIVNRRVMVTPQIPDAPRNLTAAQEATGLNKATLTWQIPQVVNGTLRGYQVEYKPHNENNWRIVNNSDTTPITDTTVTIDNLNYNSYYDFRVLAKNNIGNSSYAMNYLLIRDMAPPVISGADDVTVGYGATFDPMAGVTATDNVDNDVTNQIAYSGFFNTSLPNIYTITYRVLDSSNNLTVKERKVTINASVPSQPQNLHAQLSNQVLQVTFNPPQHLASLPLLGYQVEYRPIGTTDWTLYNNSHNTPLSQTTLNINVTGNSGYEVRVLARNQAGLSAYTQTVSQVLSSGHTPVNTGRVNNQQGRVGLPNSGYRRISDHQSTIKIIALIAGIVAVVCGVLSFKLFKRIRQGR